MQGLQLDAAAWLSPSSSPHLPGHRGFVLSFSYFSLLLPLPLSLSSPTFSATHSYHRLCQSEASRRSTHSHLGKEACPESPLTGPKGSTQRSLFAVHLLLHTPHRRPSELRRWVLEACKNQPGAPVPMTHVCAELLSLPGGAQSPRAPQSVSGFAVPKSSTTFSQEDGTDLAGVNGTDHADVIVPTVLTSKVPTVLM